MSATSTLRVSRNMALLALAISKWGHLSDEELEAKLDKRLEGSLYNTRVQQSGGDGAELFRAIR